MLEKLGKPLLKSPRVQMLEMLSKFFRLVNALMMINVCDNDVPLLLLFTCIPWHIRWFWLNASTHLQDWGKERKDVGIVKIVVDGAGFKELNQEYVATSADEIPTGIFSIRQVFFFLFSIQVSNGFAGRKVGMPQTHGGSSTGTQSGSKLQLKCVLT